jgi:hypothetical protein
VPDLPQKKVGIVACSGEEMAEGTVTRLAALVTDLVGTDVNLGTPRRLNDVGREAVDTVAKAVAPLVDNLLGIKWSRRSGAVVEETSQPEEAVEAKCSCGSGIPVLTLTVEDRRETLLAVPAIFEQLYQQGKRPETNGVAAELLQTTSLYNAIAETFASTYQAALLREFEAYCRKQEG